MASQRHYFVIVPLVLVGSALAGGLWGRAGQVSAAAGKQADDEVNGSLNSFTKIYDVVEQNYADKLSADKGIYKGAIPGALRTLDPHSNFFDPKDFASLREEQHGRYYGVGMQIGAQPRTGKPMVIAPFGGFPAYKAGIRPGDLLVEVNDKRVDSLSTSEVADLLKGPRGTKVQIVVSREAAAKPITFNIIRDEIPHNSVEQAFWIKPGIAYLRILSFTETTGKEVEDNLKRLGEPNIKGLVLDLRENPGGLLQEGVAVAGRWLQRGQTVVSHRGRAYSEKPYLAKGSMQGENYPIVVVVNRFSASAAEIVAGALQDHDRAWVFGDTTFGKGLVQTVYPLSDNTGLALTTQHYYTPSGRLIQRDYANISFLDYYYGKRDDKAAKDKMEVKQTDLGRVVYGGGGISPDEKYEVPKPNKFQIEIVRKNSFFNFTAHYFSARETKLPKNWVPDEAILNDFHEFVLKQDAKFTETDWTANRDWLKNTLKAEMYVTAFSYEDSKRIGAEDDQQIAKAIAAMPKAKELLDRSKARIDQQRASR